MSVIYAGLVSPIAARATIALMRVHAGLLVGLLLVALAGAPANAQPALQEFTVRAGSHPHTAAPARDGGVWFTAQAAGYLGWLDPSTGDVREIPLGPNSAPHGVIVGPDGAAWVTDSGQNTIVRIDPQSDEVRLFPLSGKNVNLNTATFDGNGVLWFTGENGVYGRLDPSSGDLTVYQAPRGPGPYGITSTPDGSRVFFASLAGNYIAEINIDTGEATAIDPPTPKQGARRLAADSNGAIWVTEWNVGQVARYDPSTAEWREWKLPGTLPQAYAVYVDEQDMVWLSDWVGNALVRFDPTTEGFQPFVMPESGADIRQILGRPGEVWAAESARDKLVVLRH